MGREALALTMDLSSFEKAAEALTDFEIGPKPSRTNPRGDRRKVLDPRNVIAPHIFRLVDDAIASIKALTPTRDKPSTGSKLRDKVNARRMGGTKQSKGSFDLVFEIGFDIPDERQVVVNTLEFGSVPHRIRPVNATMLRFEIDRADFAEDDVRGRSGVRTFVKDEGGETVTIFTELVEHPGTRPHGMFRITEERIGVEAQRVADEVSRIVADSFRNVDTKPKGAK